jgi:Leucine rich repeat
MAEERALRWLIDEDIVTSELSEPSLQQRYALTTLWFQTTEGFGNSAFHVTWAQNVTKCVWLNVNCTTSGQVERMDMFRGNVTGHIPNDLGPLTALTYLSLSKNSLNRSIPSSFGSLTALNLLALWNNSLNGTIPSSLGSLTDLIYLSLRGNALAGIIPSSFELLTALTTLDLSNNTLGDSSILQHEQHDTIICRQLYRSLLPLLRLLKTNRSRRNTLTLIYCDLSEVI